MMTDNEPSSRSFDQDRTKAEANGTALPERVDDFAPADLYHTAEALHTALRLSGSDLASEIDAPDDSALWGVLDAARAAALLQERDPQAFAPLAVRFPWLSESADTQVETGAMGAIADQFLPFYCGGIK